MSKLTFADSFRFDALVKDVFPGVSFTDVEDQILTRALEQAYSEARLELIPSQVRVCACVLAYVPGYRHACCLRACLSVCLRACVQAWHEH